jgi:type II secretory pathway component PulC
MNLSLAKRYVWILNFVFGGLLLHSIIFYITKEERVIWILPPVEKSNYQIPVANSSEFVNSRKEYNVIIEKNVFKGRAKTYNAARDLFLADFSKTKLNLVLLGTVRSKGSSTAIIKNRITGEIKTFAEGDAINLINTEEIRLVQVSECVAMIERKDRYETIGCNTKSDSTGRPYGQPSNEAQNNNVTSRIAGYKILNITDGKGKSNKSKSYYEEEIVRASKKHGVDPDLVRAVIKVESNFNPNAVSPNNAIGIMQIMPETARDYRVNDPFDPKDNIDGGVRILKDLMVYFNDDIELALAAYNAGKGAVVKYGFSIPPYIETIDYVDRVLGNYSLFKWDRH